jgi:hypothetical protein
MREEPAFDGITIGFGRPVGDSQQILEKAKTNQSIFLGRNRFESFLQTVE